MADDEYSITSRGEFAFVPDRSDLFLRIPLQAADGPGMANAKFKLTGKDSGYSVTLTGADDLVPGDDSAELLFEDCSAKDKYSLEVDPGGGKPKYFLFKDKPFRDLAGLAPEANENPGGQAGGGNA